MTQQQSIEELIQAFRQAEKWLFSLITDPTGERYFQEKSMEVRMTEFREQIERMGSFLELIGSPQNSFPSIHVAGTSGKGSVVQMLASILRANGLKTGYHVSPYLQVCLEKLIVDGKLIRPSEFAGLVAEFRAEFEAWTAHSERFDTIKYGEAWVALTYKWMAKQQVDWAVIETGLGGRFDPTNVLQPRLTVITNVNYDHVEVWVHVKYGAFMRIRGYDGDGTLIKEFQVEKVMQIDNKTWTLEKMQVSTHNPKNGRRLSVTELTFDNPKERLRPRGGLR